MLTDNLNQKSSRYKILLKKSNKLWSNKKILRKMLKKLTIMWNHPNPMRIKMSKRWKIRVKMKKKKRLKKTCRHIMTNKKIRLKMKKRKKRNKKLVLLFMICLNKKNNLQLKFHSWNKKWSWLKRKVMQGLKKRKV